MGETLFEPLSKKRGPPNKGGKKNVNPRNFGLTLGVEHNRGFTQDDPRWGNRKNNPETIRKKNVVKTTIKV